MNVSKVSRFALSAYAGAMLAGCGLPSLSTGNAPLVPGAVDTRSHERVLHSFLGASDGSSPSGDLLADSAGNLHGTTVHGGMSSRSCYIYGYGCGTVFELVGSGRRYRERVLHMFSGGNDGEYPSAALVGDGTGAMYGTTTSGGGKSNNGTVFKIVGGEEQVIWSFKGGRKDGCRPTGNLIAENATLYGTTEKGGVGAIRSCEDNAGGNGTVFSLTSAGAFRVIYRFKTTGDGQHPHGGLLFLNGALYGTTVDGGTYNLGTLFKFTPSRSVYRESYLYSFKGANGALPNAGLIADASGALYGTTAWGGDGHCYFGTGFSEGCGVVFKLTPRQKGYTETTLYSFQAYGDGAGPFGDLLAGANRTLYGTTRYGGANDEGTVFALTPRRKTYVERVLWSFGALGDGQYPAAGLIADSSGALYGTTTSGGALGTYGTVFEVRP
jgi:uncharacterized repeat protein (TIGR03803 family)